VVESAGWEDAFLAADVAEPALFALARDWSAAGRTVRIVRGRKMRTVEALSTEFAFVLRFPSYFGENWGAFDESMADLEWLPPGNGYLIVIQDAASVFAEEPPEQLAILVKILTGAAVEWAQPVSLGEWWDRPSVPFHVVLQGSAELESAFQQRWTLAGARIGSLWSRRDGGTGAG
jgi:hypothetical protein